MTPQNINAYRRAYDGQFGEQYLVGPKLATYQLVGNNGVTSTITVTPTSTSAGYVIAKYSLNVLSCIPIGTCSLAYTSRCELLRYRRSYNPFGPDAFISLLFPPCPMLCMSLPINGRSYQSYWS